MIAEIEQHQQQDNYRQSLDRAVPVNMDNQVNLLHENIVIRSDQITSA